MGGLSLLFNRQPGGDEGGGSGDQVWRPLVAGSLCKVVLLVYSAQEAAQLFNMKRGCEAVRFQASDSTGGAEEWCDGKAKYGGAVQECTEMQLQKTVQCPSLGSDRWKQQESRAGRRAAVI